MSEQIDHAAEARDDMESAREMESAKAASVYAQLAQAEATLALANEVKQLRESFGQCDHGYTICPFCIRNAMEGVLQ